MLNPSKTSHPPLLNSKQSLIVLHEEPFNMVVLRNSFCLFLFHLNFAFWLLRLHAPLILGVCDMSEMLTTSSGSSDSLLWSLFCVTWRKRICAVSSLKSATTCLHLPVPAGSVETFSTPVPPTVIRKRSEDSGTSHCQEVLSGTPRSHI